MSENSPVLQTEALEPKMALTASKVTDIRCDGLSPAMGDIELHFEQTIFWNWDGTLSESLDEQSRIDCEWPLSVREMPADEDGCIERHLRFELGECSITVATVYEGTSDETARPEDAEFIACLPIYLPVLFRSIRDLRAENDRLGSELAIERIARVAYKELAEEGAGAMAKISDKIDLLLDKTKGVNNAK